MEFVDISRRSLFSSDISKYLNTLGDKFIYGKDIPCFYHYFIHEINNDLGDANNMISWDRIDLEMLYWMNSILYLSLRNSFNQDMMREPWLRVQ